MTFPHLNGRAEKLADSLDLPAELAEWLAVSALHSGCFLRSQLQFFGGYDEESRRSLTRVIRKLIVKKLITETPFESLGLLARITNKTVYRLIGADNIRHRRLASWPLMFRRLLSLDYVLDHPQLPWLPTESEKVACFDQLGIDRTNLPRRVWTTPPDTLCGSSLTSTRSPSIPAKSKPTSSTPTPKRNRRRESVAGVANTQLFGPI